ncbi:MAG: molecular chaperone DnaK, partial [Candidatus Binatus sp.]|jgi:DnaK suppressor protein|nr:molecular chaperone DnaK [Candidatus Binatus sp.]
MATSVINAEKRRIEMLRDMLERERTDSLTKVNSFRQKQSEDALPPPGDEMDVARSLADVETDASLIERARERLRQIDEAFARLGSGEYGTCARCGEEIPLARLKAVPFAQYCVDCQQEINDEAKAGRGAIPKSFARRWTPPEGMSDTVENGDKEHAPEDELSVQSESAFGPEEDELESMAAEGESTKRRRGRPPKSKNR